MRTCKTIKEYNKKDSSLNLDTLSHKYNSYCCPLCTSLPEILCYNQGSGTVKLICKNHGEKTLEVEDYMEKMSKFERTSEIKFQNRCSTHNEQFAFYCKDCKLNLCKKCKLDKKHEKCITYEISSLNPDKKEILYIKNIMEVLFQKKDELVRKIKSLDTKITFYDTLINTYESQNPNYYLNINLKHLVYGEDLNFEEIKNSDFAIEQSKKEVFDDFIKNNFKKATEGLDKLNLPDKNMGNSFLEQVMKGIDDTTIYKILKFCGQIQGPKEFLTLKNIKILNIRGNNLSSLSFITNKDFPYLENLNLSDNKISSLNNLKQVSFPQLKELYLSKNLIEDINILAELKIPKLRILWLSNNKISSIDILQNVNFPQLLKISLSYNNIDDISVFSNKKVKFPQLYELYLNDNTFEMKKCSKIIEELFLKIKQFYY